MLRRVIPALSPVAYRRELPIVRTAWDFTGHDSRPFSSGGDMHHPEAAVSATASSDTAGKSRGVFPGASLKGGSWRDNQAEMPSPEVIPPGPFDTTASSGTPVAIALAAYPRTLWRGSSGMFCTGAAPHRYASTLFYLLSFLRLTV